MPNQLIHEKSPYLQQHKDNPVDWLPWGEAAFEKARREDKPIFLSIGYSTCHWCHVMERESFENDDVAQVMNDGFVCIKVDREERPDVDRVYMTFVQATTGSGGWPMSVWLTPELKPFYGGTYFPPRDAYGRPGFVTLLHHLNNAWKTDRENIEKSAQSTTDALQNYATLDTSSTRSDTDWTQIAEKCYRQIAASFDAKYGGFGDAPKFPRPVTHDFLHGFYSATQNENALQISLATLRAMCDGGLNDQIGGGFHRYSVDSQWIVSHFEKMLYDQAQLVVSLIEAFQLSRDERFSDAARQTLDYVLRDLTHENGGFFAGEDADSFAPEAFTPQTFASNSADSTTSSTRSSVDEAQNLAEQSEHTTGAHKEEGAFYVWTTDELQTLLGDDAAIFGAFYGAKANGNAPREGDPHGEFAGKNILYRAQSVENVARQFAISVADVQRVLDQSAAKLFHARELRPRPHRDEKIIVAWNGLMISAFARAARVLDEAEYLLAAQRAAQFVFDELWDESTQTLRRHWKDGASEVGAFADDFANLARACLDLYAADFDVAHLQRAEMLIEALNRDFWDEDGGALFASPPDANILLRLKDDYDGAEPSANSVAAITLLQLANLLDRADLRDRALRVLEVFAARVSQVPQAMPELIFAALMSQQSPQHLVIVGNKNDSATREMLRVANIEYSMLRVVILRDENDAASISFWNHRAPWTQTMQKLDNQTTAYVCRDFACQSPTSSVDELRMAL